MAKNGQAEIRSRLEKASQGRHLVHITRDIEGTWRMSGHVVGLGRKWVLLAVEDDSFADGHAAIRIGDVYEVVRDRSSEAFVERSMMLAGTWPPRPLPGMRLDRTAHLLTSAGGIFPLIEISNERSHPDEYHIGRLVGVHKGVAHLQEISPAARWKRKTTEWPLREISQLAVGGRYEAALLAVGHNIGESSLAPGVTSTRRWFGVRCVFRFDGLRWEGRRKGERLYEERITLWRATSGEDAIECAEADALTYALAHDASYTGFAQSFDIRAEPVASAEVFSLMRASRLGTDAYLDAFFDSGGERERKSASH